ncbi:MAG TPA: hypothetical protein VHT52_19075 [Stellaceae bacterium]|nr:hypothetical protein [Stellaceae bacterium]
MTRHHVIPYNRLVQFWNTLLVNRQLGRGPGLANGLLNGMIATLNNYQFGPSRNNNILPDDRRNIIILLEGMRDGTIRHDEGVVRPDEIDNLAAVYQWLPGNLFIGPQNRSDDPGAAFETGAVVVVGGGNFSMYRRANDAIQTYLGAPGSVDGQNEARQAADNLSDIATIESVFPLNPNNRVKNPNGSYRLASIAQSERVAQLERAARAAMEPAAG